MQQEIESIHYKDWYLNQANIPDKQSQHYQEFFDFHEKLCKEGVMLEGEYINPFLYWHLNFWHTEVDSQDQFGNIKDDYIHPLLRDNEWIVTNEIDRAHKEHKGLVILGIRRFAKALRNDELLYTETGEIEIGNASVGDRIYDHNGQLTSITGVYPQGKVPIYKITLEDGREIRCCEDHLWRVKDKRYNKIKTLSLKELLPIYKKPRIHNGYKDGKTRNIEECFFAIPNNDPIKYNRKKLTVDSYFLGLWLGDGSSRRTGITTIDKEIIEYIYSYAEELKLKVREDDDEYIITSKKKGGTLKYNFLLNMMREMSLIQNKHIPDIYLKSSVEQRLALLQGLMDSDGSCYKNGTIAFVTTSEKIAEGFFSLCRSLGINLAKKEIDTKLNGKSCGRGWRFNLFTELPVFRLQRKLSRMKLGNKGRQSKINWTTIRNIELEGKDFATCITVDNKDKLFLTTNYTTTHNSVLEASYIGWGATFDEDSQNVIAGLNAPDIKLVTDKLDKGLNSLPDAWTWQRIEDNWKQQVTLGIKTRAGVRIPFSQILIRNLDEGNNEEAIAGTKPRKLIIDEIGKGSFLRGFQAATPGFTTPFGWGCSPILTGTGGDMTKFFDAKTLMFDVENYNFLSYPDERKPGKTHGLFLSYKYRLEAKEPSTLGAYLNKPTESELHNIPMQVSNPVKAKKITKDNVEKLRKGTDRIAYLKEKMYYPLEIDDIFLNEDTNIFPVDASRVQKAKLLEHERTGTPVILFHDGEKITHKFTDKLPITNFPLKPADDKDAPIVIYEFPIEDPPYGLYTAGVDSYRQGKARYSDSLGTVFIFKRMTSITGEGYQNLFVASYAARPDKKEIWDEQARMLIKYYNARTLIENDEMSFIDYMVAKGDARYLEPQPQWLKEIVPNTTVNRPFGIHRSAEQIRDFLHGTYNKYLRQVIHQEKDELGSVIKEIMGVTRVFDPMLLEETIQYNELEGNFDRIIAAELAVALAAKLDPILGSIGQENKRVQSLGKKRPANLLFSNSRRTFVKNKSKLFM